jgi:nucleoside-diphosphate-sugar epimerase
MHIILGAGGPVANALTTELENNDKEVRLVSRKPVAGSKATTTWQKADLLNYTELLTATKGATIIYLCAGLVYDKDVWKQQWPVIMQNVINVTKQANARLIFFDNVYMYGPVNGPMTETTPYNPTSEKGKIRAGIADMVMNEVKAGKLDATIARGRKTQLYAP